MKNLFIFKKKNILDVKKPLTKMSIDEIIQLVSKLNISSENNFKKLIKEFSINNLNGLVLQSCDLVELKDILKVNFFIKLNTYSNFNKKSICKNLIFKIKCF